MWSVVVPQHSVVSNVSRHKSSPLPEISLADLQLDDPVVGFVLLAVEADKKPPSDILKGKSLEARLLMQRWGKLQVIDDVLWRHFEDEQGKQSWLQLIVPGVLRNQLLEELHAAGVVLGEDRTFDGTLKRRFYWPGYSRLERDWCRTCATCGTEEIPRTREMCTLSRLDTQCRLWHSYCLFIRDCKGLHPPSK